ncbi:MAG: hypothetical protein OXH57_08810 [Ekhidna sp.]|nr:hypothetical protein [Ekhidna sp.]
MRYDLGHKRTGRRDVDSTAYKAAFPNLSASNTYSGYMLTKNLDFQDGTHYNDSTTNNPKWTTGAGWDRIGFYVGSRVNAAFTGTFDGKGYTIANLYLKKTTSGGGNNIGYSNTLSSVLSAFGGGRIGLFGYTSGAAIKNLGLVNPNVINTDEAQRSVGDEYVGSLIEYQENGTTTACYVSGGTATGYTYVVGGLVGQQSDGAISNCYVSGGSSTGGTGGTVVGGLVGTSDDKITACYVTGRTINGEGFSRIGGLVGQQSGSEENITACYVSGGTVTGKADANAGGLIGFQADTTTACYVFGTTVTGGTSSSLVGRLFGDGTVNACYAGGRDYSFLLGVGNNAMVTNGYFQRATPSTFGGKTATQLRLPTAYSGIYENWNLNIDGNAGADNPWNFGTASQYPILHIDFNGDGKKDDDIARQAAFAQIGEIVPAGMIPINNLEQLNAIRYGLE